MRRRKRKWLGKRARFMVLRRDQFTCQYCGRKAPGVVLHVDHVVAVACGGTNDFENLVTACEDCNLGKLSMASDEPATDVFKAERALDVFESKLRRLGLGETQIIDAVVSAFGDRETARLLMVAADLNYNREVPEEYWDQFDWNQFEMETGESAGPTSSSESKEETLQ